MIVQLKQQLIFTQTKKITSTKRNIKLTPNSHLQEMHGFISGTRFKLNMTDQKILSFPYAPLVNQQHLSNMIVQDLVFDCVDSHK